MDVDSSGCPMLGLGDNVPLGTTASFERSEVFYQVVLHVGVITKFLHDGVGSIRVDQPWETTDCHLSPCYSGWSASPEFVKGTRNLFTAQHKRRMALKFESLVA